jgi:predicted dehydrogenase
LTLPGPLRVAIVGSGGIAPAHAEAYAATGRTQLVGVVDVVPDRARQFAERYGCTHHYPSVAELMADQAVDLVSVTTPPGTHTAIAVQILQAGASVLLEKPPCLTLADLDIIAETETRSAGSAYAVFQHRHGSGARRARHLLSTGELGVPQLALCETLWFRPESYFDPDWRGTWSGEGGGPTLGHGIHQIDLLLHLLRPWVSVNALAGRVARPVEFEDVSLAMVTFGDGSVGSVINSLLSPQQLSRIRIDTTAGTLEVNHLYGYHDADWTWTAAPDSDIDTWERSAADDVPSNHLAQISRLVEDLLAGRPHETTLASARPTMEFVTGLYASALLGRPVTRLDLVPGHPFYDNLSGGLSNATISARLATA